MSAVEISADVSFSCAAGVITICTSTLERDRVTAAGAASGLALREHWEIIPRAGKPALVAVDVFGDAPGAAAAQHTLTVRDHAGAWTLGFREVRTALGMPSTPP